MLDYRIQQLFKGSSEGSDVSNDEENKAGENKADAEVAKKQAGNKRTVQGKLEMLCWWKEHRDGQTTVA
ncbi:hypothetical protein Tco_0060431 [Tanacetum coccineum]